MLKRLQIGKSKMDIQENSINVARVDLEYDVIGAALTDKGCSRSLNEDSVGWVSISDSSKHRRQGMLIIVADGMGGHAAGEVASRMAVDIILESYLSYSPDPYAMLENAFYEANQAIFKMAELNSYSGMGTTCTALLLLPGGALCAHVGDSRLYLVRDQRIFQMSEDDSLVAEMVRRGQLSSSQARKHEQRNVILRALGTQPTVDISIWSTIFPVNHGDRFVLCSDGLTDLVDDDEIRWIVINDQPNSACQKLIDLALSRGGYDNITVGVFQISQRDHSECHPARNTREYEVVQ